MGDRRGPPDLPLDFYAARPCCDDRKMFRGFLDLAWNNIDHLLWIVVHCDDVLGPIHHCPWCGAEFRTPDQPPKRRAPRPLTIGEALLDAEFKAEAAKEIAARKVTPFRRREEVTP